MQRKGIDIYLFIFYFNFDGFYFYFLTYFKIGRYIDIVFSDSSSLMPE